MAKQLATKLNGIPQKRIYENITSANNGIENNV